MSRQDFESILDDCLNALERGDNVDACLARYPQQADRLRPLLSLAQSLQRVPPAHPRPTAQAAAQQRFYQRASERHPARGRVGFGWRKPVAIMAVTTVLALVGVALAFSDVFPDDFLWNTSTIEAHEVQGSLASVDERLLTIITEDGDEVQVSFTEEPLVSLDGQTVGLAELPLGTPIKIEARPRDDGSLLAVTIEVIGADDGQQLVATDDSTSSSESGSEGSPSGDIGDESSSSGDDRARLDSDPAQGTFKLRGTLASCNLSSDPTSIEVEVPTQYVVVMFDVTEPPLKTRGDCETDRLVDAKGAFGPGGPDPNDDEFTAKDIKVGDDVEFPRFEHKLGGAFEIRGTVSGACGSTFSVDAGVAGIIPVTSAGEEKGDCDTGVSVRVRGYFDGHEFVADRVEFSDAANADDDEGPHPGGQG